ncbi:tol-pal system YbgF family protein [Thermodesulfobacteriota bacterium]
MAPSKAFTFIIVSTAITALLLTGCAAPPSQTSSEMAAPPAPEIQDSDRTEQLQTAPSGQTEQDITPPPEVSLKEPVFDDRESTQIEEVPVSYADLEFVQQRQNAYQVKLDEWLKFSEFTDKSELAEKLSTKGFECIQLLEWLVTGYGTLLERMQQGETVPVDEIDVVDPGKMLQLDINFLESRCSEVLAMDTSVQHELTTGEELHYSFDEAQKIIISHVKNENFQEALQEYSNLSKKYPEQKPTILTQLNYGLALQYMGQVEAATRHFSKMLNSGDLSVAPLNLQLEIADLLLASGDISAAESYYENFIQEYKSINAKNTWAMEQLNFLRSVDPESEDMLEYTKLLREFFSYDYKIHSVALNEKINTFAAEHAGSPFAVSVLRLKSFTIEQLNFWLGRQLVKIDSLVAEKRFTEAMDILKDMTHYYLPADLQAVVQKTFYEVGQAELEATEDQRRAQEMELTEQWDTAVNLMDSQRFETAISAFEAFTGTEYEKEAAIKIVEAANLAAGQMRKEAASLFVRANKTLNIESKKQLFLDSYEILNEIVITFPQTDLLDKVYQNISIVEEQIKKIDPLLLEELQDEAWADTPDESQSSYPIKE